MTEEQAIKLAETRFWEEMTYEQRARFQLVEKRLCMPFGVFHEAIEKTLGRPVFTHEFGLNYDALVAEMFDGADPPTMEEIMEMISADKRIVVELP